jgi:hypothetical protein
VCSEGYARVRALVNVVLIHSGIVRALQRKSDVRARVQAVVSATLPIAVNGDVDVERGTADSMFSSDIGMRVWCG